MHYNINNTKNSGERKNIFNAILSNLRKSAFNRESTRRLPLLLQNLPLHLCGEANLRKQDASRQKIS